MPIHASFVVRVSLAIVLKMEFTNKKVIVKNCSRKREEVN